MKQSNSDGSDMYIPVYDNSLYARIDNPFYQPKYVREAETITKTVGDVLPIVGRASQAGSTLQTYFNGALSSTITGTKDSVAPTLSTFGAQTIIVKATNGANINSDMLSFYIPSANTIAPLPAGVSDCISGRQLYKQSKNITPGTNEIEISEAAKFLKGIYMFTIIEPQQTQNIKLIKCN